MAQETDLAASSPAPTDAGRESLTFLLRHAEADQADALFRRVEDQLRRIAQAQLRGERANHSLQATQLIDDAFLKLIDGQGAWHDRRHFFRAAAKVMRNILVDHERARRAAKRGGQIQRAPCDPDQVGTDRNTLDLLALDEALNKLATIRPRQAEVVQLLHFGGYSTEEIAQLLDVSASTVKADHQLARVWLFREMSHGA